MSNSSLISFTKISPNKTPNRSHKIDTITIHCVVGQCSVEALGNLFASTAKHASSNYGIGYDGKIGMYVEEKDCSWCSSSTANDSRAVTIEVASDTTHPYAVTDKAYAALIDLVTDICKRNGITELKWKADKSLIGQVDKQNMTVHRWFAPKACPGEYLYSRHADIAAKVNKRLKVQEEPEKDTIYRVQVGAFSNEKNAKTQLQKIEAAGFDAFITQVDGLYKVQVGAFTKKENAQTQMQKVKKAGFDAFITTKGGSSISPKKTVEEIAKEVIAGKWGSGAERKNRLTQAGYDYEAVQAEVNRIWKNIVILP